MRKPTRIRKSKSVSCRCLQRKPILRFRHQWETRLVGLPARVKESLPTRQLHQPIFTDEILDNFGRLLSKGCVEGQPVPGRFAWNYRAIGSRFAPGQHRTLSRYVSESLGGRVVCCSEPELGVCVVENLLRPCWPEATHQVGYALEGEYCHETLPASLSQQINESRKREPAYLIDDQADGRLLR